jgi:hypothetical protein
MSNAAELDLTGRWSGIYNYPHTFPSTAFEATIRDSGGLLTGETVEAARRGGTLHALIEGQRQVGGVRFIKSYDELPAAAHPIEYVGQIAAGGDEIHGTWYVAANWSGTFLMVREGDAEEEIGRLVGAEA